MSGKVLIHPGHLDVETLSLCNWREAICLQDHTNESCCPALFFLLHRLSLIFLYSIVDAKQVTFGSSDCIRNTATHWRCNTWVLHKVSSYWLTWPCAFSQVDHLCMNPSSPKKKKLCIPPEGWNKTAHLEKITCDKFPIGMSTAESAATPPAVQPWSNLASHHIHISTIWRHCVCFSPFPSL